MNGLGFVIEKSSRIVFIDIDHCIDEDGKLSNIAHDILSAFRERTYVEISQSGNGLHILTLGEIPRSFKNSKNGVEMYSDGRYVAFTGDALIASDLEECPDALRYVFDKYKTEKAKVKSIEELRSAPIPVNALNGDSDIVSRASHHGRFTSLYNGEFEKLGYSSQSEADLALCITIAYWCDRNPDTIDRLFRSSRLYRPKWEREDYRNATIVKACSLVTESFTEWKEKKRNEHIETLRSDWD
jgi:putative DNA primase/helicase